MTFPSGPRSSSSRARRRAADRASTAASVRLDPPNRLRHVGTPKPDVRDPGAPSKRSSPRPLEPAGSVNSNSCSRGPSLVPREAIRKSATFGREDVPTVLLVTADHVLSLQHLEAEHRPRTRQLPPTRSVTVRPTRSSTSSTRPLLPPAIQPLLSPVFTPPHCYASTPADPPRSTTVDRREGACSQLDDTHFQVGFVVPDLEAAMEELGSRSRASNWSGRRNAISATGGCSASPLREPHPRTSS